MTMTPSAHLRQTQALRRAAVRATLAPSVHNTQPWRFVIGKGVLQVHADWARQLPVLDPSGRQLLISCGCALFNARVAVAAAGYDAIVDRSPDPTQAGALALVSLPNQPVEWLPLRRLDAVIELRQSNRRRFADDPVPRDLGSCCAASSLWRSTRTYCCAWAGRRRHWPHRAAVWPTCCQRRPEPTRRSVRGSASRQDRCAGVWLRQMRRWTPRWRGSDRRPGMNGSKIRPRVSSAIRAHTSASALPDVENGLIWYQKV